MNVIEAYNAVNDWDLDHVQEYLTKKLGWSAAAAAARIEEYRRYIALVVGHGIPNNLRLPISREVDEVWHTHVLFTRDYREMCSALIGGFIDHYPVTDEAENEALAEHYRLTLEFYDRFFGPPPPKLWGTDEQVCDYNGGCYDIGQIAA